MTTTKQTFVVNPIPRDVAARLRSTATGEVYIADAEPGFPCRQCLRDAEIGDELVLVSHDPFEATSPYRSASPIFLHRSDCGAPPPSEEIPEQLRCRTLSVRAFDAAAMMSDAAIINGEELLSTLGRFFEDSTVDFIHVHNASRGCWATTITRA